MNRTFLIFLMIATALMIAVLGRPPTQQHSSFTPWDIRMPERDKLQVFGITLGKTHLEEANQILSSFPKTQLHFEDGMPDHLVSRYKELNLGGLLGTLVLESRLTPLLIDEIDAITPPESGNLAPIPEGLKMETLTSLVYRATFLPQINMSEEEVLTRFGPPEKKHALSDDQVIYSYPTMGLSIQLNHKQRDRLTYQPPAFNSQPLEASSDKPDKGE